MHKFYRCTCALPEATGREGRRMKWLNERSDVSSYLKQIHPKSTLKVCRSFPPRLVRSQHIHTHTKSLNYVSNLISELPGYLNTCKCTERLIHGFINIKEKLCDSSCLFDNFRPTVKWMVPHVYTQQDHFSCNEASEMRSSAVHYSSDRKQSHQLKTIIMSTWKNNLCLLTSYWLLH